MLVQLYFKEKCGACLIFAQTVLRACILRIYSLQIIGSTGPGVTTLAFKQFAGTQLHEYGSFIGEWMVGLESPHTAVMFYMYLLCNLCATTSALQACVRAALLNRNFV